MEGPTDEVKLRNLLKKCNDELEKTLKLIEALRTKANNLAHKGEHSLNAETRQSARKQAITELEGLIEKLVCLNIDLELDFDCANLVIPYFTPDEDTVHNLKFLSGDDPWHFWLVDKNVDTKGILKNILRKYQNGLLDPVTKPQAAQSVCFVDKNKAIRGIITQIKNENRVKLVDCDSNITKIVTRDKLFQVDDEACRVHASVLRCAISEDPDAIDVWKNSELRHLFCNTLREATLAVKIIKRVDGPFPMFVVDIELKNEDDDSTASLREWILNRLLPELKKVRINENEPVCDYLSEELLSPYYKEGDKVINQVPIVKTTLEQLKEDVAIQNEESFNLNYPTGKLSEKMVTTLNRLKEENNTSEESKNDLGSKVSTISKEGIVSSSSCDNFVTSSSKMPLSREKTELIHENRLNQIEGDLSKSQDPDIQLINQNNVSTPQYHRLHLPHDSVCLPKFSSYEVPWFYGSQSLQQVNNSLPYHQQTPEHSVLSPCQDSAFSSILPDCTKMLGIRSNEVNVMAPEFIPRIIPVPQSNDSNQVEFPKEPIMLRKSATLIKENENLVVLISHVETPSEFYVHFVTKNNKYLDKLNKEMFKYYSTKEEQAFVSWREARNKLGKFCACKWSCDNYWYRVEVLDWTVGDKQVKVWFVDYGNTEFVPLSSLQPLNKNFEKLFMCCQACHLAKVHPIKKGQPWSKEAIDFFKSKVKISNSNAYSITVVRSNAKAAKENSLSVLLYDGKATDTSKSINDLLVEQGLAWSRKLLVEPASSVSSENYHSMEDDSDNPTDFCDNLTEIVPTSQPNMLNQKETNNATNNYENVPELLDAFDHWDPRREDYESARNNPSVDTDDACVAVTGYSARDEARICKFYAREGFCYKAVCSKEHSIPNPGGITTDKEEVYVGAFSHLVLPKPGEVVRLRITYVSDVNLFYAQIEEKKGVAVDDEFKDTPETLTSLQEYMNQPENIAQMKGLSVPPSLGEMVLAREVDELSGTEVWYRARVITTAEDDPFDNNHEVMFVDFGSTCTVPEKDLRKMENRYLHLPFQAIECSIANVIPVKSEQETLRRGRELLQDVLLGHVLTAKIYERFMIESNQQMEVVLESEELGDIGEFLIANGFATAKPLNWHMAVKCETPLYYPG